MAYLNPCIILKYLELIQLDLQKYERKNGVVYEIIKLQKETEWNSTIFWFCKIWKKNNAMNECGDSTVLFRIKKQKVYMFALALFISDLFK